MDKATEIPDLPFARELVELRSSISSKEGIGVYAVFNNEQLVHLCKARPKTLLELSKIPGFPEDGARVSKWGEAIIEVFSNHASNAKSNAFR